MPYVPEASPEATLRNLLQNPLRTHLWNTPRVPKIAPGQFSGHVACSKGESEGGFEGDFEGWLPGWLPGHKAYFKGVFQLDLRDMWHSLKLRSEGVFEGGFERAFGRA